MMTRDEFVAAVDWPAVRESMAEKRAEIDVAVAQHVAECRAAGRVETLADKELLAAMQGNADLLDAFLAALGDE
jgi:hypothetical protein